MPKPAERVAIDTLLDLGYVIRVLAPDPIKIKQDPRSADPFHSYTGCSTVTLISSFPAQFSVRATGTSVAAGKWDATIRPSIMARGTMEARVCVTAKELVLDKLRAGTTVKVAEVIVTVMPR